MTPTTFLLYVFSSGQIWITYLVSASVQVCPQTCSYIGPPPRLCCLFPASPKGVPTLSINRVRQEAHFLMRCLRTLKCSSCLVSRVAQQGKMWTPSHQRSDSCVFFFSWHILYWICFLVVNVAGCLIVVFGERFFCPDKSPDKHGVRTCMFTFKLTTKLHYDFILCVFTFTTYALQPNELRIRNDTHVFVYIWWLRHESFCTQRSIYIIHYFISIILIHYR